MLSLVRMRDKSSCLICSAVVAQKVAKRTATFCA